MRFLRLQIMIMAGLLSVLQASAAVENFNNLIQGASKDEKSLHQKVLESMPESEISKDFNSSWEKVQNADTTRQSEISVRLVTTGE